MSDSPAIQLPQDHYAHPEAQAEWWWNIGTLRAGSRTFGFEIAADSGRYGANSYLMSQIMLSDVENGIHYQTTKFAAYSAEWAQSDPSKTWGIAIAPEGGDGAITMTGLPDDPLGMRVTARFTDAPTGKEIKFDLRIIQKGAPMLVFGTGARNVYWPSEGASDPIAINNYYYSLTRLTTSGDLWIGGEKSSVQGLTWMDHEYGAFPSDTTWVLQSMQLDNGVHIMNFAAGGTPEQGRPMVANATVLTAEGESLYFELAATCTPWCAWRQGPETYFLSWEVAIPAIDAYFTVTALIADQVFPLAGPVYEGVARAQGHMGGEAVSGTAWIEQRIYVAPPATGGGAQQAG